MPCALHNASCIRRVDRILPTKQNVRGTRPLEGAEYLTLEHCPESSLLNERLGGVLETNFVLSRVGRFVTCSWDKVRSMRVHHDLFGFHQPSSASLHVPTICYSCSVPACTSSLDHEKGFHAHCCKLCDPVAWCACADRPQAGRPGRVQYFEGQPRAPERAKLRSVATAAVAKGHVDCFLVSHCGGAEQSQQHTAAQIRACCCLMPGMCTAPLVRQCAASGVCDSKPCAPQCTWHSPSPASASELRAGRGADERSCPSSAACFRAQRTSERSFLSGGASAPHSPPALRSQASG